MYISKECNGKCRVQYEMFKKEWVINKIFSEKAKKGHQLFWELWSQIFPKSDVRKTFSSPNVLINPIVRTGTYFVKKSHGFSIHYL